MAPMPAAGPGVHVVAPRAAPAAHAPAAAEPRPRPSMPRAAPGRGAQERRRAT